MYKTILITCLCMFFLLSCNDSNKKTWQINYNINNELQAWDEEGFIDSGDEWIFLENVDVVLEWQATKESDESVQVSTDNPLNF
jgi:hypothetical protein